MFDYITLVKAFVSIYGVYLSLGLICFIIACVFGIFLISILTKTPFGFSLGFFKINFGSKYNNVNRKALVDNLLEYQEDFTRKILNLESGTLKRQLNYCEQKLTQLKFILTSSYSDLLSTKLQPHEDVKLHKDYRSYQMLISMLIKDLIDNVLRDALIENHLDSLDTDAWKNYISDKTNYILNYMEEFLDNLYSDGKVVHRNESYEAEKKLFPDIKDLFVEVFNNVREIGINSKNELKKEKESSLNEIKEICQDSGFSLDEK